MSRSTRSDEGGRRPANFRATCAGLAIVIGGLGGCGKSDPTPGEVRIAAPWTASQRADFLAKLETKARAQGNRAPRIRWVRLNAAVESRPAALVGQVDLILDGSRALCESMRRDGLLARMAEDSSGWLVARELDDAGPKSKVVRASSPGVRLQETESIQDPRVDARHARRLVERLAEDGWKAGYAAIVDETARGSGRPAAAASAGSIREASVPESDENVEVAAFQGSSNEKPEPGMTVAAVIDRKGLPISDEAQIVLRAIGPLDEPGSTSQGVEGERLDSIVADLVGASILDADQELSEARRAVERAGSPPDLLARLGETPLWPPASIGRLRERGDTLPDELTDHLASDLECRGWLLVALERPSRPIEWLQVQGLANAVDGRLANEPVFRAWLSAEMRSWARAHAQSIAKEAAARAVQGR